MLLPFSFFNHAIVYTILSSLIVVISGLLIYYAVIGRRPRNFPPGPPTLPVLGNLHQLSRNGHLFLQFQQWSKEYGSIIGLKFGSQNVVVLNTYHHVRELFDKRGNLYSSRPHNYLTSTLICPNDTHILFTGYGSAFRARRKTFNGLLNVSIVDKVLPIQNAEASYTMHELLALSKSTNRSSSKSINVDENRWYNSICRFGSAVILATVFGQRAKSFNHPRVQDFFRMQERFMHVVRLGATPPVDAFPILKYIPGWIVGGPWKEEARAVNRLQRELYDELIKDTRQRMESGLGINSFMAKVIDKNDGGETEMTPDQLAYIGGNLMEGGSETTASTLLSFVLAMVKYPRALSKCQEEVDSVCGMRRSPTFDDASALPYIQAVMKETLRWRPVVPDGVPHTLTADDWYEGYFFPKGTQFQPNTWAINHDESQYKDPASFIPERWLNGNKFGVREELRKDQAPADLAENENGDLKDSSNEGRRVLYSFGAGRRACPGRTLAEHSLMIMMSKLAWAFDIDSPLGSGDSVDAGAASAYKEGFSMIPKCFPATFTPRSEMHARIIEEEFVGADAFLTQFDT